MSHHDDGETSANPCRLKAANHNGGARSATIDPRVLAIARAIGRQIARDAGQAILCACPLNSLDAPISISGSSLDVMPVQCRANVVGAPSPPDLAASHTGMNFREAPPEHLRRQRLQIVNQTPFAEMLKGVIGLKRF